MLLASVLILLTNPGFMAIQAHAWGTWESKPQWEKPQWEKPQWENPGWTTPPTWEDPTWTVPPEWQEPNWTTPPQWKDPTWKLPPQWNDSYWKQQPQWNNSPWKTAPKWELNPDGPGQTGPNNPSSNPDGTNPPNPDGKLPGPSNNSDDSNPDSKNKQIIDKSDPASDEAFFNFKDVETKDAASFAVQDVIGGTTKLAIEVVTQNKELTMKDLLDYKKGIYLSGFKSLTKGDTTVDFLYDSSDTVSKAKGVYDSYNTFKGYKALNELKKAGDLAAAAQKYDELLQAGKTFTPANAVVSAIAMPFTIMDTVENVGKFNKAKNFDDKVATSMDLVGNAGSIISGAAAGVALIPGAQPIAAGMMVVGGVLTVASLGHKLYRNREKVMKDVKEKFKKAKEKVTGFFKSVFGG